MIIGIQLDFTTDQLRQHVEDRKAYHQTKAEWYAHQIDSLRAGGVRPESASNDPIHSLEGSLQRHRQNAALFGVIAEHLVPEETYRLSQGDLVTLELVSRFF